MRGRRRLLVPVLAGLALAACGGDDARTLDEMPPTATDTLNDEPLDGISRTQLEQEAVPMSPEAAEAAGLVDETIHIENLGPIDTIPIPPPGQAFPAPEGDTVSPAAEPPAR